MIYLFDDTNSAYIQQYIQPIEFTDVLRHVSAVSSRDVKAMEPSLLNAEWIFIHKSFKDSDSGSREVYEYIVNDIADYGEEVPLILFSDEDLPKPSIDKYCSNLIEAYQKSVFYSRIAAFLEDRRASGHANIELLLYGAGIEVEKVTAAGNRLLALLRGRDDSTLLKSSDISPVDLMHVINSARPNVGIEYVSLMDAIEGGNITISNFRYNLKSIIESFIVYGTNIHSWK